MSAATARKKNQPALATSGRGAAFCVTFGIVSITLGQHGCSLCSLTVKAMCCVSFAAR